MVVSPPRCDHNGPHADGPGGGGYGGGGGGYYYGDGHGGGPHPQDGRWCGGGPVHRGRGARCGYAGGYDADDGSCYGGESSCGGGSERSYGGGSHRGGAPYASQVAMATAATAAVQAGEAEAARLKQRAQRLLRERGAVESEIEELQATLVRTRRELSATQEQIDSAASERTSLSTADMRRHATQLQALSKAQAREKRRLLAARTQAAKVEKTLEKKREQLAALRARLEPLRRALAEAPDEAAREAAEREQLATVAAREERLRTARDTCGTLSTHPYEEGVRNRARLTTYGCTRTCPQAPTGGHGVTCGHTHASKHLPR